MKTSIFRRISGLPSSLLIIALAISCKSHEDINPNDFVSIPSQLLANTNVDAGWLAPNGWFRKSGSGSYTAEWSTEEASSASYSLKISTQILEANAAAYWSQQYSGEMPVGNDLTLTAKIKTKNMTGTGVSMAIRADNSLSPTTFGSKFITTEGSTSITGNFDWTTFSVKLSALPKDTKYIYVFLLYLPNTTGNVYFDDITLTASGNTDVPGQILLNKNVESRQANTDLPSTWYKSSGSTGTYTLAWTNEEVFSTTHSLKASAQTATSPDFSFWSQQYSGAMPVGKDLILTAKIKTNELTGQGISIAIRADNALNPDASGSSFISTQNAMPITGTSDWTSYSVRLESLRSDAKYVYVFLIYLPNTTGTVYFDDISLTHN